MNLITAGETRRKSSSDKRYMLSMASLPGMNREDAPFFPGCISERRGCDSQHEQ